MTSGFNVCMTSCVDSCVCSGDIYRSSAGAVKQRRQEVTGNRKLELGSFIWVITNQSVFGGNASVRKHTESPKLLLPVSFLLNLSLFL